MNRYQRETDEFAPIEVKVNGVTPPASDIEFAITKFGDRPSENLEYRSYTKERLFFFLNNSIYGYYSDDGINWTRFTLPFPVIPNSQYQYFIDSIAYSKVCRGKNGLLVVIVSVSPYTPDCHQYSLYSTDNGDTWNLNHFILNENGIPIYPLTVANFGVTFEIVYNPTADKYLLTTNSTITIGLSDDGINWYSHNLPSEVTLLGSNFIGSIYDSVNKKFVLFNNNNQSIKSDDGLTWVLSGETTNTTAPVKFSYFDKDSGRIFLNTYAGDISPHYWVSRIGDYINGNDQFIYSSTSVYSNDGNYLYVLGGIEHIYDLLLIKYDKLGNIIWQKQIVEATAYSYAGAIFIDQNYNLFIMSFTYTSNTSDIKIIKVSSIDGNIIGAKKIQKLDGLTSNNNNIIIINSYFDGADINILLSESNLTNNTNNILLIKYNILDEIIVSQFYYNITDNVTSLYPRVVKGHSDYNLIISQITNTIYQLSCITKTSAIDGTISDSVKIQRDNTYAHGLNTFAMAQDSNENIIILCDLTFSDGNGGGGSGISVIKLDKNLNVLWSKTLLFSNGSSFFGVLTTDIYNNIYVLCGISNNSLILNEIAPNSTNSMLFKINENGDILWQRFIKQTNPDEYNTFYWGYDNNSIIVKNNIITLTMTANTIVDYQKGNLLILQLSDSGADIGQHGSIIYEDLLLANSFNSDSYSVTHNGVEVNLNNVGYINSEDYSLTEKDVNYASDLVDMHPINNYVFYSDTDGDTWNTSLIPKTPDYIFYGYYFLKFKGIYFILVNNGMFKGKNYYFYSLDKGVTWLTGFLPDTTSTIYDYPLFTYFDSISTKDILIVLRSDNLKFIYTLNGTDWLVGTFPVYGISAGTTQSLLNYVNGYFFMCVRSTMYYENPFGSDAIYIHTMFYSKDGIHWDSYVMPKDVPYNFVNLETGQGTGTIIYEIFGAGKPSYTLDQRLNYWFNPEIEGDKIGVRIKDLPVGKYNVWSRIFTDTDTPVVITDSFEIE